MKSYVRERKADLRRGMKERHEEASKLVHDSAVRNVPKATRYLMNNIRKGHDEEGFRVGTDVFYGNFVELGTGIYRGEDIPEGVEFDRSHRTTPWVYYHEELKQFFTTYGQHPHPFLVPALLNNRQRLRAIYGKPIRGRSRDRI